MNQPSASDRPSSGSLPPATAAGPARSASLPLLPLLLLLLALADLRTELLLLVDHFTVTSLLQLSCAEQPARAAVGRGAPAHLFPGRQRFGNGSAAVSLPIPPLPCVGTPLRRRHHHASGP